MAYFLLTLAVISASGQTPSSDAAVTHSHHANGFIYLQFQPPVLRVRPGGITTGRINITIHDAVDLEAVGSSWIVTVRSCCTDPEVAQLLRSPEVAVRLEHIRTTVFSFLVAVRGVRMGRTTIRFYVTKNCSRSADGGVAREIQLHLCAEHNDDSKPEEDNALPAETEMGRTTSPGGGGGFVGIRRRDVGQAKGQSEEVVVSNLLGNNTIRYPPRFLFLNFSAPKVSENRVKQRSWLFLSNTDATPHQLERLPGRNATSKADGFSSTDNNVKGRIVQSAESPVHSPHPDGNELDNSTTTIDRLPAPHPVFLVPVPHDDEHNASEPLVEVWWIPQEYHVIVCRPFERSTVIWVNYLLMALTAVNLVGIGGQMDWTELTVLLRRPLVLALGLFARFVVMPVIGLTLVELLHPSDLVILGSLIILCTPTDGASCLLILLVDGDLTLSFLLATVNNFASFGMLPLWGILFEKMIYAETKHLQIPLRGMTFNLFYMTLSFVGGHVLHRRFPRTYFKFWLLLPPFTVLTVLFVLLFEICSSYYLFQLIQPTAFVFVLALVAAGYSSGAFVAYLARQSRSRTLIVCVETGVRTTHVVGHVLMTSLPEPDGDFAHAPATLYAVLCLLPAIAVATVYRVVHWYRLSVYAETECKMEDRGMTDDLEELCPRSSSSSSAAAEAAVTEDAAASSPSEITTAI